MAEPTYQPRIWHLIVTAVIALFGAGVMFLVLNPRVEVHPPRRAKRQIGDWTTGTGRDDCFCVKE